MAVVMLPIDASSGLPSYTAQDTRQALSALFGVAPSGRPLGAVSGVRPGTPDTTVTLSGGGSTTWNVAAHAGVLDTQTAAAAGPYAYATDGADTGSITAADASNPRIDIVYVKVNDDVQDGSGLRSGQVLYLAGTAASSPDAPSTPARGMAIAHIAVPTSGGGAPSVTWVAPTFGGPQASEMTMVVGALREQWGTVSVTITASDSGTASVTFPVAFSGTPNVQVTMNALSATYVAGIGSVSSTGFTCTAFNRDASGSSTVTLTVDWRAIGPA